ncbi:uncharacterized protein THITE_155710 [Thermothielavioides terrestris NRRL 8126]|uniref:Uncharacterized protein n=1 Tax=Thermothielavioides terrestris (strain ATCC 38088 / NRRL 8126) TaxID=578455 RepID=G2RB86_THETT|nr:uncharacterized protein THITE_155710 [Thermothielavioides terrestris NRRL 8126]AEO69057.1 hypothetical protein THITE_155710 [Thermothielavioides terrestris NRRL 8126]
MSSSSLLRVPDQDEPGRASPAPRKTKPRQHTGLQEIPSWFIRPGQLHCLLTTIFPNGEYDVDIDQDVYKIRAPRAISLRDIIRFKRY